MNKGVILTLVLIVLAIGIYFFVFNDSDISDYYNPSQDSKTNSNSNNIEIRDFMYSPKTLTISVGETVTWTNYDSMQHTVTSDSGDVLNSELLGQGKTYSMTFTEAGTYDYHCTPHPYMKGKIIIISSCFY